MAIFMKSVRHAYREQKMKIEALKHMLNLFERYISQRSRSNNEEISFSTYFIATLYSKRC